MEKTFEPEEVPLSAYYDHLQKMAPQLPWSFKVFIHDGKRIYQEFNKEDKLIGGGDLVCLIERLKRL